MDKKEHPVWEVYDHYRTARLNVKYYSHRLASLERWNFWLEVTVAVSAPTSAISGIWFFDTTLGRCVWSVFMGIAAVAGAIKPFMRLGQKIKEFEKTASGYRSLEHDLYETINRIKNDREYSVGAKKLFDVALKRRLVLVKNPPEAISDEKLVAKLWEKVNEELPNSSFYVPEKSQ